MYTGPTLLNSQPEDYQSIILLTSVFGLTIVVPNHFYILHKPHIQWRSQYTLIWGLEPPPLEIFGSIIQRGKAKEEREKRKISVKFNIKSKIILKNFKKILNLWGLRPQHPSFLGCMLSLIYMQSSHVNHSML